jgi:hypothetical protein
MMSIPDLLERATAELRGDVDLDDLALAAAQLAHLLGALRMAGERRALPPPHSVMAGVQGLRLWALAIKESQAAGIWPEKPISAG